MLVPSAKRGTKGKKKLSRLGPLGFPLRARVFSEWNVGNDFEKGDGIRFLEKIRLRSIRFNT